MKIWFNGDLRSPSGLIDLNDRGFLLGDGLFETIAVIDSRPAFLREHLERLAVGLKILNMPPPSGLKGAGEIISKLARVNEVGKTATARITISRGAGPRGLAPPQESNLNLSFAISATSHKSKPHGRPRLIVSTRRRFSGSSFSGFKSAGNYGENILALMEAEDAGADDAVLLNEHGAVVCATASNIFLIGADDIIRTPRIEDGAMPGVVRGVLIEAVRQQGIEMRESEIRPAALAESAIFLTNSLIGLAEAEFTGAGARRMTDPPGASDLFKRLQTCYGEALAADLAAGNSAS